MKAVVIFAVFSLIFGTASVWSWIRWRNEFVPVTLPFCVKEGQTVRVLIQSPQDGDTDATGISITAKTELIGATVTMRRKDIVAGQKYGIYDEHFKLITP